MVSGSNLQRSQHHSKENDALHQIKEVVERQDHGKKKEARKRDKEETELGRSPQGKGKAAGENSTFQVYDMEQVLGTLTGGQGMGTSLICEPPSRYHL